jgi:hypothetical protein
MLVSRGRAAFAGIFVLVWALPSCFGADGASGDDDDDGASGGTESSGATGGSGPGSGGSSGSDGSGATGGGIIGEGGTAGQSGGAGGTGGSGGNVVPPISGAGGTETAGTGGSGTAGSAGTAGTAGAGGTPGAIGGACESAADCDSGFCLTPDSTDLDGAGPPGGLCTVACADQTVCDADAPGTLCVPFTETVSYCLEVCEPGSAAEPKCQTRPDLACVGVGTFEGTTACETLDDCPLGQVCTAAVEGDPTLCSPVASACAPSCRGDFDCGSAQYCDLLSGMCVPGSASGLAIGSPCDPAAEPDPCSGFCIAVSETEGMCSGGCGFSSTLMGCGWDGTPPADAICLFLPPYVDPMDVGLGDSGLCGPLCDCNDDCGIAGWGCFDIEVALGDGAAEYFGRAGVCRALAAGEALTDGIACEQ